MTLLPYGCFGLCNDFKRHLKPHLLAVLMTSVTQRLGGLSPPNPPPPANFAYVDGVYTAADDKQISVLIGLDFVRRV